MGIPGAGRRRTTIAAFAVGWVLIAGGTAGAVVAVGRGHSSQSAAGAAVADQSAAPTATPTLSSSPSPSATSSSSSPAPSPTTSKPSPSSTVTGKVSDGVHSGDIRYFLMAVPSDASVVGPQDGDKLTAANVAASYSNSAEALKALQQLGFKDGASRSYQTGDAKYHVDVRLLRFGSADTARTWASVDKPLPGWTAFGVPGYPDEKAYDIPLDASLGEARLRAVGFRGDVFFEINVFGEPPVDHQVLIDRVRKQIARLDTGS